MKDKYRRGLGLEIAECLDHLSICRDSAADALNEGGSPDSYNRSSAAADEYAAKLWKLLDRIATAKA